MTVGTAAAEIGGIGAALDRTAPIANPSKNAAPAARSWSVTTAAAIAREQAAGAMGKAGGALVLIVSLVLVVACTNIANLTLGRGTSRVHEFAVRRALGASRGRLIREQCAESAVLAAFGAFGAFIVASMLCQYLTTDIPTGRPFDLIAVHPKLGASALLAASGALLVSLVVFGVVPALQLTRVSLRERLAGDAAGAPPARWKGRRLLIAGQVAISTAFIIMAAASVRAVTAEARQDPGFDLQHLAVGSVSLRPLHGDTARAHRVIEALGAAAHAQPGFESVAVTAGLPMGSNGFQQIAQVSSTDQVTAHGASMVVIAAAPTIFRTLGVPILRGRAFDDHDAATTHPVIVTSELAARQVFGTTDVVGRQMSYRGPSDTAPMTVDVIGVARDTDTERFFGQHRPFGSVYVPLAQHDSLGVMIVGRTAGDPAPMAGTFAGIVRQADPDLAVRFASTGEKAMTPANVILQAAAKLSAGVSILAVTLAMLGLYGVLSHLVARRTREIGLRLALGAEPGRVRQMIIGEGLSPVVWGLSVGMFVGVGARVVCRAVGLAPNIAAIDLPALAVAAVILVAAGFAACYVPARRASNVDPNVALRDL
jgi:putative ABC transport system permease protein